MNIKLVVAAAENNVIGKDNHLLWHLPNDLAFFKNQTWGLPVIMGRKTFDAMGKPLAGRTNIVITRQHEWNAEGVIKADSLSAAVKAAEDADVNEISVIGGGEIYKQAITIATKIVLTRVHATLDGDTYFPEFSKDEWKLISAVDHPADERHKYSYTFQEWIRTSNQ